MVGSVCSEVVVCEKCVKVCAVCGVVVVKSKNVGNKGMLRCYKNKNK